jgi:CsoR family transcriptional regulator, copper-sensing transcriptional repressor
MIPEYKQKAQLQLKKASGTLKKVMEMLEKEEYCVDVLQQSLAVMGLLKSANKTILENHLNSCFKEGMDKKNCCDQEKLIGEVLHIVNKL